MGALGVMNDCEKLTPTRFQNVGDRVLLVGQKLNIGESSLAASEYLSRVYELEAGNPYFDFTREASLQKFLIDVGALGLLNSAHDCSDGGVAVAIAECCILGQIGFQGIDDWQSPRWDTVLFGELPSRVIISCDPAVEIQLKEIAEQFELPITSIGTTSEGMLSIQPLLTCSVQELSDEYYGGLKNALL